MATATGGCMCGAVRYECSAAPMFMGNCHCRDCQRASGGGYAPAIGVPRSAVKITGDCEILRVEGRQRKHREARLLPELRFTAV